MSDKSNAPIEQDNSKMMEKLRQMSADDLTIEEDFSASAENDIAAMSDDDIRERLKSQFMFDVKREDKPSKIEQTYSYDESFLLEAVAEDEAVPDTKPEISEYEGSEDDYEEELVEELGESDTELAESVENVEVSDGDAYSDDVDGDSELIVSEDDITIEEYAEDVENDRSVDLDLSDPARSTYDEDEYFGDDDDDLTFDDIEETADENDAPTFAIVLDDDNAGDVDDDDLTFDDIAETADENDAQTFAIALDEVGEDLSDGSDDEITDGEIAPEEIAEAEEDIGLMLLEDQPLGEPLPPEPDEYGGDSSAFEQTDSNDEERISIYSLYNRVEDEIIVPAPLPDSVEPDVEETAEISEEADADYETVDEDIDGADEYGDDIFDVTPISGEESLAIPDQEQSSDFLEAIEKEVEELVDKPDGSVDQHFLDDILDADAKSETFTENTAFDKIAQCNPDGAEIALLLQLGCEDEIIGRYDKASLDKLSEEEALKNIPAANEDFDIEYEIKNDGENSAEEGETDENGDNEKYVDENKSDERLKRINDRYDTYGQRRGALFIKLVINALIAIALLIYEGLPALGVELGGILNREDYTVVPYVLIALSLVILACFTSYKRLWEGLKALISPLPNVYSMVALLGTVTLIYDISIMFVRDDIPPTFHLPVVLLLVLAIVRDCQLLSAEKSCFEFFFGDELFENVESTAKFTLVKNVGRGSVAEKMYAGGFDSAKNVYSPIEISSEMGFFRAVQTKSKRADVHMVLLIPSIAFSAVVGIFALLVSEAIWVAIGGMLISMALTLPIVATISSWLPFERLSAAADVNGYAFASEGCLEESADCDMMIFNDLHMFAPCDPSSVNLALYDATDKAVLLGCLSAVYGEIGGPLGETFAAARDQRFEKCRLTRVAKIGVEAIVGTNYSVLIGSENFMSRYGVTFPTAVLKNKEDGVFTVCVSINGRATARVAVRYTVNEIFEMFVSRLAQDGIGCVIRTFDPMISAELLKRARRADAERVSIVHMSVDDYNARKNGDIDTVLFDAAESELKVSAHGSRFNLAVAMSAAKRMRRLRKYCNRLAFGMSGIGALIALAAAAFDLIGGFSSLIVLLYWAVCAAGLMFMIIKMIPTKSRFSFERFKRELEANDDQEK